MRKIWLSHSFFVMAIFAAFIVACGDSENSIVPNTPVISQSFSSEYKNSSSSNDTECSSSSFVGESCSSMLVSSNSVDELEIPTIEMSSSSEEPGSSAEESSSSKKLSSSRNDSEYDPDNNTLTDYRDGKVYSTKTIRNPKKDYSEVWMAENLNYKTTNSYCYEDSTKYCDAYGRLYTWVDAVAKSCPKGWHLPTEAEWKALIIAVDGTITEYTIKENGSINTAGKRLKSKNGWGWHIFELDGDGIDFYSNDGSDAYGFSALPAGCRGDEGRYGNRGPVAAGCGYLGISACFWSSQEVREDLADYMYLKNDDNNAYLYFTYKSYGCSVRCIKD